MELWADNNHHWHLKQRIGPRMAGGITRAVWQPEEPLTLYLSDTATAIVRMELHAAAAVVDGSGILYLPFSNANVPPTTALQTLEVPQPLVYAVFGNSNDFGALLADAVQPQIQLADGRVRQAIFVAEFDGTSEAAAPHTGQVLAAAADSGVCEIAAARPSDGSNRAVVVVGHSARNQLFANEHPRLRFVPANTSLTGASGYKFEERQRRVERGSVIVLAALVAMPWCCRCRVNRIGLDIVHDHAPAAFMADLPEFVRQVDDPDLLNLFSTALRDDDVAKSMYAGMDGGTSESKCLGKTSAVCRALRLVFQLLDPQRYMPTMLTTLHLLSPLDAEARDAALTYLLYLSDVDTVYNAALGMYDLPLALVVAQRSQHDPREYLPALGKLHAIASDDYRR
ncbi:putative elongator complex protein 1 [Coemansia helicoidea]|uniref:Elongator complex protein 1 n=1 Tax=Coemansia helicoidea TaxID=1286919 RepID=A0ACC1L9S6_9FUNG|nr:putative elongator complex protein 1 [Coemansia helicoidea]